ncbi:1-acylglycerol-3-phosphate o-acyltransferase [Mycena chlorophos]|uniref:1-acylglycerol-3-phosphate o-acyltransferase n=1 Tax=Mycena chlorophos TaxID=658473 RepID=A0A8H6WIG0_MYCCL|nr:1-acylglycerol-3-phosphate o-acyltransferase [Mycena chlorophos]
MVALLSLLAYATVPLLAIQSTLSGRYYTRRVAYVVTMSICGLSGLIYAVGMVPTGSRYNLHWMVARTFFYVAGPLFGLKIEIEGEEYLRDQKDGGALPAILMANHQSMLDIFPVGRTMPKRGSILSKKSIQYSPLGPFMMLSGAVFIDRGNSASALKSLDQAVATMKSKRLSLWLFPEGTRHCEEQPTMLPFKKGGFHLAIQAGFPIVPIVFENYWRLYHKDVFDSGVIRVKVLPPVPTTGLTTADIPDLMARVREQMLTTLIDISVKVPSTTVGEEHPEKPIVSAMPDDAVIDAANAPKGAMPTVAGASVPSLTSSSGTETETEDEDTVLVDRPT